MNANNIKFRCSSLSYLMTEPQKKSETLSETTKTHLVDVFVSKVYGRKTEIHNKYTIKGLMVEEDSITLYSRVKKVFFKKNEDRIENDFICGTPDLFVGSEITKAEEIVDVKSSWDIFTFFRTTADKLNKNYYWQMQGYMALTGAKKATLAYCLVNTPDVLIQDQKRRLMYNMGLIDENQDFVDACAEIDRLSVYDDIPMVERVNQIVIERNDEDIERLYKRIAECRAYMNERFFKSNISNPVMESCGLAVEA